MKLLLHPNSFLETPVKPFDIAVYDPFEISAGLTEVMIAHSGLGLSANQVGFDGQIFTMTPILNKSLGSIITVINPVVLEVGMTSNTGVEGCLSHPGLYLNVKRPKTCTVEFMCLTNNSSQVTIERLELHNNDARIFLHEYDHLMGVQFTDRVSKTKLCMAKKKRQKRINNG